MNTATAALDKLDTMSVSDLSDLELSALMAPEFDWEAESVSVYVMAKIQSEFNARGI